MIFKNHSFCTISICSQKKSPQCNLQQNHSRCVQIYICYTLVLMLMNPDHFKWRSADSNLHKQAQAMCRAFHTTSPLSPAFTCSLFHTHSYLKAWSLNKTVLFSKLYIIDLPKKILKRYFPPCGNMQILQLVVSRTF